MTPRDRFTIPFIVVVCFISQRRLNKWNSGGAILLNRRNEIDAVDPVEFFKLLAVRVR